MALLPWDTPELIKANLATLATLKKGNKLSVLKDDGGAGQWANIKGNRGLRERFKVSSWGFVRAKKGESILEEDQYLKPLTTFFEKACAAYWAEQITIGELEAGARGLKQLEATYASDKARLAAAKKITLAVDMVLMRNLKTVTKDTGLHLPPGSDKFPTVQSWKNSIGNEDTPVLSHLTWLLRAYEAFDNRLIRPKENSFEMIYLYADVFLTAGYWLKHNTNNPREQAVHGVWLTAVRRLCRAYKVAPNVLPEKLEKEFGKRLYDHHLPHGDRSRYDADVEQGAYFLSQAEREKYRLVFKEGRVWQYPWWQENDPNVKWELRLANSRHAAEIQVIDLFEEYGGMVHPLEDRFTIANFVMGMDRELYLAQHCGAERKGKAVRPFYHSTYLQGQAVLCAGGVCIIDGMIHMLTTGSGHYRPFDYNMLNVLQTLVMHGISLRNMWIRVHVPLKQDNRERIPKPNERFPFGVRARRGPFVLGNDRVPKSTEKYYSAQVFFSKRGNMNETDEIKDRNSPNHWSKKGFENYSW